MGIVFSADEILEMAEQIERNGAKFYRKAVEGTGDDGVKKLFGDLAEMEDQHEKTFAGIREQLSGREKEMTAFDPEGEAALYLQAFADGHVFDTKVDPSETLTGSETPQDILQTAIGLEKDSIVFYLGIRDMVPEKLGKGRIDDIMSEEKSHITLLSRHLAS